MKLALPWRVNRRVASILYFLTFTFSIAVPSAAAEKYVRYSAPDFFTYDELVALSENVEQLEPALAQKLQHITTTPFISNEAYYRGAKPLVPDLPRIGPSLRVICWNIERGVNLDKILLLFQDSEKFIAEAIDGKREFEELLSKTGPRLLKKQWMSRHTHIWSSVETLDEQINVLKTADVLVLNEVDWGMRRSNYRAVIQELGEALNMNWAYGVEFVEIDPKNIGTATFEGEEDPEKREQLLERYSVDRDRLKALHGTAILSRYPIRAAYVQPFETIAYDWYQEELGLRPGEQVIRGAITILGDPSDRELRRGGRMFLTAVLDVPQLREGCLTVVSPHLENRTKPKNRQRQMEEVFAATREIRNPVIVAGDFNSSGGDAQSFKLERNVWKRITKYDFWADKGFKYATGVGIVYDLTRFTFDIGRSQSDPTVVNIPYLSSNREKKLFTMLENFRFADGNVFDFRGDPTRSANRRKGTLGNSNERAAKGFRHTYEFVLTVGGIGKTKLDWVLVKAYAKDPRSSDEPYRFAPHFGRTMLELNYAIYDEPLSDHYPMSVDLPFAEPPPNLMPVQEIRVHGLRNVPESKVLSQLKSRTGESYSEENLAKDRERLDRMALFSKIDITANEEDDAVTLDIEIKETLPYLPHPAFNITDEQGVTIGGGLKSTNFLGRGTNLSTSARFGGATEFEVITSSAWRPFPSNWYDTSYFFRDRNNKLDQFRESSHEFNLQIGRQVTEYLRMGGRFKFLTLSSDVPGITLSTKNRDNIPGVGAVLEYDSRDSWTSPRKGWWNSLDATANGLGADGDYWTFNVDVRRFQPMRARTGLFVSSLLTMQTGAVGREIPIHQDFHIGGTNSLRGWDIDARNGKNQFLNTIEWRYDLMKPRDFTVKGLNFYIGLQLAIFGDFGSAWSAGSEFTRNFIAGGGFGLRLIVPYVNLIRFDFGFGQSGRPISHIGVLEKAVYQRRRVR